MTDDLATCALTICLTHRPAYFKSRKEDPNVSELLRYLGWSEWKAPKSELLPYLGWSEWYLFDLILVNKALSAFSDQDPALSPWTNIVQSIGPRFSGSPGDTVNEKIQANICSRCGSPYANCLSDFLSGCAGIHCCA